MKMPIIVPVLILIIIGLSKVVFAASKLPFRLIALDVGEGQSILLQHGRRGILVDTGHAGKALSVIEKLQTYGVRQLDYLILTHLHPDHASGYFRIKESFPEVPVLVHNFTFADTTAAPDMSRWVAEALRNSPARRQFRAGDKLDWAGLTIRALWPGDMPGKDMNDSSLVIEVIAAQYRILLMGDVGIRVEKKLVEDNLLAESYDVLVAGHHGSKGTSSEEFLKQVNPAYSIISTDADNIRGYPDRDTVGRLRQYSHSGLFSTYEDGDICLQMGAATDLPDTCRIVE